MITSRQNRIFSTLFFGATFAGVASLYFFRPYHPDLSFPAPAEALIPAPPVPAAPPPARAPAPASIQVATSQPMPPAIKAPANPLVPPAPPPPPPPVVTARTGRMQSPEVTLSHYLAAQTAVGEAQFALAKATKDNKGGYVQKGLDHLTKTLDDLNDAIAYIRAHPEPLPVGISPRVIAIASGIDSFAAGGSSPNLRHSLACLKTALDHLQLTPDDPDGHHLRVIADIAAAGSDTILGIKYADGSRGDSLTVPF